MNAHWKSIIMRGASSAYALAMIACSSQTVDKEVPDGSIKTHSGALTENPTIETITLNLPAGLNRDNVTILAEGELRLNDRVYVYGLEGSSTTVANMKRGGETNIGVEAEVGHVTSRASVVMRDRAHAAGNVRSASTVRLLNGAHVDGTVVQNKPIAAEAISWPLPILGQSAGDVHLEPDLALRLEPGTYGAVHIKSRSTLYLHAGDYMFDSLFLEPESNLVIDDENGIVSIYLTGDFTFRGSITPVSGMHPKLVLVTTGTNQVTVDAHFTGSIVAPNAKIALISTPDGHEGTFFGKDIEVQPGTKIRHHAPDWDDAINGHSDVTLEWKDGTAVLRAADPENPDGVTDGHVELSELISFEIPARIRVNHGNAGNHQAVFSYRDQLSSIVTCTYHGGSTVAEPTGGRDLAAGLHYDFESCSNGSAAESTDMGNEFWLTIEGVADPSVVYTEVEVHLNGCGGTLEPPMEPEESVDLVEAFSWENTSPVPEYDAEGRAALYYALIYLEDPEQLGALEDAYIHWDPMPLFESELEKFDGQCGAVRAVFDGEGIFVYAMLPGVTYNLLREYALAGPDPETGEEQTIFDVVILKTPPEGSANPDGSISFTALADSGFLYLNTAEMEESDDEQQQPRRKGKFRKWCRKIAKKIGKAVRNVVRGVVLTLGAINNLIAKECNLYLTMKVYNRDPFFISSNVGKTEMTQAWGADPWNQGESDAPPPRAVRPNSTKVDIKMWGMGGPVPMLFTDTTNEKGIAHLRVPRSDQIAGAHPRGKNPVCMHLDHSAATITSFLLYERVCDFGSNTNFSTGQSSSHVSVESDHKKIHLYNALLDANRYFRKVVGYEPQRVQVLTGWFANRLTSPPINDHRAFAFCLGLASVDNLVVSLASKLFTFPLIDAALLSFAESDIVMPDNTKQEGNSRGIMVHEYGHFAFCSLLQDASLNLLPEFLLQREAEGKKIFEYEDVSVLSDAYADFFASQVVGGVDYTKPSGISSHGERYCVQDMYPCLEGNATGINTSGSFEEMEDSGSASAGGFLELARVDTIWHDAFDGHYLFDEIRNTDVPGNVDYYTLWSIIGDPYITVTNQSWGRLDDDTISDENVALPGSAIRTWINKWPSEIGSDFTVTGAMQTLTNTMYDHGVTWCDACKLYSLHEDGSDPNWSPSDYDLWVACTQGRLADYVGRPPDPDLNMLAATCVPCPPHSVLNAERTECIPCDAGEIEQGNTCVPCEPGSVPVENSDTCGQCGPGQIASDGVCTTCPIGTLPNESGTECIGCEADEIIPFDSYYEECDWEVKRNVLPGGGCGDFHRYVITGLSSVPIDEDLSVEVRSNLFVSDPDLCEQTAGYLRVKPEQGFPDEILIPFNPVQELYNCNLNVSSDIREWVNQLGVDWMAFEVVSNFSVDLVVRSGPFCIPE